MGFRRGYRQDPFHCSIETHGPLDRNRILGHATDGKIFLDFLFFISSSFISINRITLGRNKRINKNRMIQLTDTDYNIMRPAIFYYEKWVILLSVIQLSGVHYSIYLPMIKWFQIHNVVKHIEN